MAGISSLGIGTGLDVNSLITQMMALERQPINTLNTKKAAVTQQISAFGQIKSGVASVQSALKALKDSSAFDVYKSTSSDTKVATATSTSNAAAGSYDITVNKLAKSRVEGTSDGLFTQSSAAIGVSGTLSFTVGSKSFSVNVNSGDTLEAVRDAINQKTYDDDANAATADKTQALVQASVINVGTSGSPNYKLVISSTGKGTDGAATVGGTAASALGLGTGSNIIQQENDTEAVINGVQIKRSSTTISDVIAGATLNLTSTGSATLSISRDNDAIASKINDFVSAYNKLQSTITSYRQKGGTLEADSSALSVLGNLQSTYNTPANITGGSYQWLSEVGLSFQKDGTLKLDTTALNSALNSDFSSVKSLFTDADQGFASRLYDTATDMLNTGGLIATRTNGLNSTIKTLDTRIDQMTTRLTNMETRLKTQFSNLDASVATMKNSSSFLSRL